MAHGRRKAIGRASRDRRAKAVAGGLAGAAALAAGKAAMERLRRRGSCGAYRFRRDETAREGVVRIALGRADDALSQLERARHGELVAGVHEARKDLKKLRAMLRLVRDDLGKKTYRRENRRFRDAARLLAGARDAEVRLRTLEALRERFAAELETREFEAARERLGRERPEGASAEQVQGLDEAAAMIAAGRARIEEWPLSSDGWELIEPGLRRRYRLGRKAMARVRSHPAEQNAHEWRKRVKDLWYHLRLLRDTEPAALQPAVDAAHELSDSLGDHHDLAVLADWITTTEPGGDAAPTVLTAIRRRQEELLAAALELGRGLYEEKPRRFSERLEGYWKSWRG